MFQANGKLSCNGQESFSGYQGPIQGAPHSRVVGGKRILGKTNDLIVRGTGRNSNFNHLVISGRGGPKKPHNEDIVRVYGYRKSECSGSYQLIQDARIPS